MEKKRRGSDHEVGSGQVQISLYGAQKQINTTTRPSPEGLFGKRCMRACGNFNAPGKIHRIDACAKFATRP